MKDVTVYRCGKVVADGVLLTHVRDVSPPTHQSKGDELLGSISLDITGTLTYSPWTHAQTPPVAIKATHPSINSDQLQRFYDAGKIDYPAYAALMQQMNIPPCVPPPPKPEHKDTTRVRRVRERIDNLYEEGILTGMDHQHLISALA